MIEIPEEYIDKCGDMFDAVVNLFSTEFTPDSIDKAFDQTFLDVKTKYNISDEDFYLLITAITLKLASSCDITCSQILDGIASYIGIDSNSEEIVQSVHKEKEFNKKIENFSLREKEIALNIRTKNRSIN